MKSCLNQLPKLFMKSKYKYELPSKSSTFPRSLIRRVPSNKCHTLPKCKAFGITIQSEVLDPNASTLFGVISTSPVQNQTYFENHMVYFVLRVFSPQILSLHHQCKINLSSKRIRYILYCTSVVIFLTNTPSDVPAYHIVVCVL